MFCHDDHALYLSLTQHAYSAPSTVFTLQIYEALLIFCPADSLCCKVSADFCTLLMYKVLLMSNISILPFNCTYNFQVLQLIRELRPRFIIVSNGTPGVQGLQKLREEYTCPRSKQQFLSLQQLHSHQYSHRFASTSITSPAFWGFQIVVKIYKT